MRRRDGRPGAQPPAVERGLRADIAAGTKSARAEKAALRAQGQECYLPVYGRRPQPYRVIRQQTLAGQIRRHSATAGVAEGLSRSVHQSEFNAAGAEVQIREVRPVGRGSL